MPRSDQELISYRNDNVTNTVTSVDFSKSGRLLFAGYDDFNCHVWDVLMGGRVGETFGQCLGIVSLSMSII